MPSITKTLHFLSSALVTSISVGVLGYCMSTQWAETTMECTRSGDRFTNGSALITWKLFVGDLIRDFCPLFGKTEKFEACLSVLVLILFAVNLRVTRMAEKLVKISTGNTPADLRNESTEMMLGYYLVILYTVLSLVAIAVIYIYDQAAYTHRREQQRPTEDAPKEIMMY
ncbi:hypothetical protein F7725_014443 [Dissostichus mawsoni]|uniref:Uncharacterized protein n=1 Tax=Dissostichus mawsoni TaxID=36200 RepID=A0A7J5YW64_DISMA|nr:hypothetical protein F7725_014443 [Dissostichus mawsoni]